MFSETNLKQYCFTQTSRAKWSSMSQNEFIRILDLVYFFSLCDSDDIVWIGHEEKSQKYLIYIRALTYCLLK